MGSPLPTPSAPPALARRCEGAQAAQHHSAENEVAHAQGPRLKARHMTLHTRQHHACVVGVLEALGEMPRTLRARDASVSFALLGARLEDGRGSETLVSLECGFKLCVRVGGGLEGGGGRGGGGGGGGGSMRANGIAQRNCTAADPVAIRIVPLACAFVREIALHTQQCIA